MSLQVSTTKRGRDRQRHHGADHDGGGQGDRELVYQTDEHVVAEDHRRKHRDQRKRDRYDREPYLPRADHGRLQDRKTQLHVPYDVLYHHDRVIDHETDREHQRDKRQGVERKIERPHREEGTGQRQRYAHHRDQGGPGAPQEEQHHQRDHHHADRQRKLHLVQCRLRRLGKVEDGSHLDIGGE